MFFYKKPNGCLFALKTEPKKIVEEEVEKDGKTIKVKKAVFDDSYTPITKEEFDALNKARHHK